MANSNFSAIDAAVAAAKAARAARLGNSAPSNSLPKNSAPRNSNPGLSLPRKAKPVTDAKEVKKAEREARKALLESQRAERKIAREAKKAAKEAEKAGKAQTGKLSKLDKAALKLPELYENGKDLYTELTVNATPVEISALVAHLQHFLRATALNATVAVEHKIEVGDAVRIVGGDARYVGKIGIVDRAQRIRCYVEVPGIKNPVYLFLSEVELVETSTDDAVEEDAEVTDEDSAQNVDADADSEDKDSEDDVLEGE